MSTSFVPQVPAVAPPRVWAGNLPPGVGLEITNLRMWGLPAANSIPPAEDIERFTRIVTAMSARIAISENQSTVLASLPDTLLTNLISGELRIPDAEKFLEEAGI